MAKKRANGEGSIRKRKDGRWEGRYTAGHDPITGKRKHLPFTVFGYYSEIIEKYYTPGQELLIEYKVERSKNERNDGGVEFFTNCIVEKFV